MKKIIVKTSILFLLVLLLNSCAVLDKYSVTTYSIDLTKFEEQGIFVTTGDISKDFNSISIIAVECYNGYKNKQNIKSKKQDKEKISQGDDIYYSSSSADYDRIKDFEYQSCYLDDLFQELIEKAKDCGANGIIKLEIKNISKQGVNPKKPQSGIEIVGLAIKIED